MYSLTDTLSIEPVKAAQAVKTTLTEDATKFTKNSDNLRIECLKQKNYKVEVINYKSLKMILKEFRAIFTKKPRETYLNLLNFFSYFVYRKQLNLTTFTINKKKSFKKRQGKKSQGI